jgi:hypothetical protein
MRMHLKQCVWIMLVSLTVSMSGGTMQLIGSPSPQDRPAQDQRDEHEPDHSTNKYFKLGERDARDDNQHRRDHFKKRKFKRDQDRQAYEAGYKAGHQGNLQEQ